MGLIGFNRRDGQRIAKAVVKVEQSRRPAAKPDQGSPQSPGSGVGFCMFTLAQALNGAMDSVSGQFVFSSTGATGSETFYNLPLQSGGYVFAGSIGAFGYAIYNPSTDETYGDKWYIIQLPCVPT